MSLKQIALDLLYTLYSETSCLGHRVTQIQIIEDPVQIKALHESDDISKVLFELAEKKDSWYSLYENPEVFKLKNVIKRFEQLLHG